MSILKNRRPVQCPMSSSINYECLTLSLQMSFFFLVRLIPSYHICVLFNYLRVVFLIYFLECLLKKSYHLVLYFVESVHELLQFSGSL